MYVCMYVCMYICTYVRMYLHVCVCVGASPKDGTMGQCHLLSANNLSTMIDLDPFSNVNL